MTAIRRDPWMKILSALAMLAVLFGGTACAAGGAESPGSTAQEDEKKPPDEAGEEEGDETMDGEVPEELLDEMIDHLAEKTGAGRDTIEVVRAEAVTWDDASLGCPEPGRMYAQMLTDGYWVILRHAGEDYDYRASQSSFILCEQHERRDPVSR